MQSFKGGSICAALDGGAHQPAGSLPRVISSIEHFSLLATNHPSKSIRNSIAGPAPCLISWETFLLFELPICSCEKMLSGGGRAWHWIGERREPAIWNAQWQFHVRQACHRTDEWSLLACLVVLLKPPSGPSGGELHISASRDGRWCCGVKRWLKENEQKNYGEAEGWGTGLKKGKMNMHSHSVSFQFRQAFPLSELELHGKVQL